MIVVCYTGIDWSQFCPGMIATFVGVALPILIDALIKKYKIKNRKNQLLNDFKLEVSKNLQEINDWTPDKILPSSSNKLLKTIVYDIALSTYELVLLKNDTRKEIVSIYDDVIRFNNCLQEQTRYYLEKNKVNDEIQNVSEELKKILIEKMEQINWD